MTDPPATLVPAVQIIKPVPTADDASLEAWREYHRQMVAWIDWQHEIETWRGSVESRLEGLEEVTNLIPEILERLGPPTLTPIGVKLRKGKDGLKAGEKGGDKESLVVRR